MAYDNLKFCWYGVISTDTEKAKAFYTSALGWTIQTMPMGDKEAVMFAASDGEARAHLSAPEIEGIPSHWDAYLRVEDIDASTEAAKANGGGVMVPPMDIPVGRFSFVTSPSGAVLALFKEADLSSENPTDGHGSIHWTELYSTDIDADLKWLKGTFGFTTEEMPIPQGTYYLLKNGDEMCAGAMPTPVEGAPAAWMSWVWVDDVDATAKAVAENGGQVMGEIMDMPGIGRMVPVVDSTGGHFGIITPAPQA